MSGLVTIKAGTDYGTYSAAQPEAAAKNMMFDSVDSQQTCYEYVPRQSCITAERTKNCRFSGQTQRHSLPQNAGRPSHGSSLCHKHFFSNSRTSRSWLPRRLCRKTSSIVCTSLKIYVGDSWNEKQYHPSQHILKIVTAASFKNIGSRNNKIFYFGTSSQTIGENNNFLFGWWGWFQPFLLPISMLLQVFSMDYYCTGLNSGVLLMNLEKMRQFNWINHVLDSEKQYSKKLKLFDQDLINIVFHNHTGKYH